MVDADLSVRGTMKAPTLGGTVTVKNALWTKRIDAPGSIVDLASRRGAGGGGGGGGGEGATPVPLRFDIQVLVPSTLHVETNIVQKMVASADLTLRGTYERPVLFGHAEVERGEVNFEGRRYESPAARSSSRTRTVSSRSSTSRRKRRSACRRRPTA